MSKLSEAMSTALYRIHDHAWSGANPRTIEALVKRGLLVQGDDRPELTNAGREAIGVDKTSDVVGEIQAELNTSAWDEKAPESVEEEAPVPFFNRKARREFKRNVGRYNRRLMRLHGKRARKYGPQNIVIRHIAA